MTDTLYETAEAMFRQYPLAVGPVCAEQAFMVLMRADRADPAFLALHCVGDGVPNPPFVLTILNDPSDDDRLIIHSDGRTEAYGFWDAVDAAAMLAAAVPVPRDGSLCAFVWRGNVTALIATYISAEDDAQVPDVSWSVMPLAEAPEGTWPPFTGQPCIAPDFWWYFEAGCVVNLAELVAANPGAIFWVPTGDDDGVIAVPHPVADGTFTLPEGRYVWHQALRAGTPIRDMDELLADAAAVDLGPRFTVKADS
jgi:hypothetical protein